MVVLALVFSQSDEVDDVELASASIVDVGVADGCRCCCCC